MPAIIALALALAGFVSPSDADPLPATPATVSAPSLDPVAQARRFVAARRFSDAEAVLLAAPAAPNGTAAVRAAELSSVYRVWADSLKHTDPKQAASLDNKASVIDIGTNDEGRDLDDEAENLLDISDYQSASDLARRAVAAQLAGDRPGRAKSLWIEAQAAGGMGKNEDALALANQALALATSCSDSLDKAHALNALGNVRDEQGRHELAIACYDHALVIFRRAGDQGDVANVLMNEGLAWDGLNRHDKAVDNYGRALSIYRAIRDRDGEADTLYNLGLTCLNLNQPAKALDDFNLSVGIFRAAGDQGGEASAFAYTVATYAKLAQYAKVIALFGQVLPKIRAAGDKGSEALVLASAALAYVRSSQYAQAIDCCNQALPITKEMGDTSDELVVMVCAAAAYIGVSQFDKAISSCNQALPLIRVIGDKHKEALLLSSVGQAYESQSQYDKATDCYGQAMPLFRATGDKDGEGNALLQIGKAYFGKSMYLLAIQYGTTAASSLHAVGDRDGEANALNTIGNAYDCLSQHAKAAAFHRQALPIFRAVSDKDGEANTLNNTAAAYYGLSQYGKAVEYQSQALAIYKTVGDREGEASALDNIGEAYGQLSQFAKAIDIYNQALPIFRAVGDRDGEASTLSNLGTAYASLSQYAKAIDYQNQALPIFRTVGDRYRVAHTLGCLGFSDASLGQYAQAFDYQRQALAIFRAVGDKDGEASALGSIGTMYAGMWQYDKSVSYATQALAIVSSVGDRDGEASALSAIGNGYTSLGEYDKAIKCYNRSLAIYRAVGDKNGAAIVLCNIGNGYALDGRCRAALPYFNQSLPILSAAGDRDAEANDLSDLMSACRALGENNAAVLFGKQAVNIYQAIRGEISAESTKLSAQNDAGYLYARSGTYRRLADILVATGRLPEAEQVLGMLKQQEYFDYIGGSRDDAAKLDATVAFTPAEQAWIDTYSRLGESVEALQNDVDALDRAGKAGTAEYKAKNASLASSGAAFSSFLAELPTRFADNGKGEGLAYSLQNSTGSAALLRLLDAAMQKGIRVAALFTIEADKQYDVVMVTPSGAQQPGAYPISASDLNEKVEAFRNAVQDRYADPRPLGRDLYNIMLGPIAKPLSAFRPDVVMWSLDGVLGMVPVAALWDGDEYLVQRWQSVSFNPASLPDMEGHDLTGALGYGVSQARTVGADRFDSLPGVPTELQAIFRDPAHGSSGPLPGSYYLDTQFRTDDAIAALRLHDHHMVHVATHFKLDPAAAADSYLLTGDGTLGLSDLMSKGSIFRDVDLLTLSACSTAVQTKGDGAERNGLDATASLLGARSILATLWDVNDASTALIMGSFYSKLAASPSMSISEALRKAQLDLLGAQAAASPQPLPVASKEARGTAAEYGGDVVGLAPFKPDTNHPFAHPYYWAPFVLLGNWK